MNIVGLLRDFIVLILLLSSVYLKAQDGLKLSFVKGSVNSNHNIIIENADSDHVYLVMIDDRYYSDSAFMLNITLLDSCGVFSTSTLDHLPFYYQFDYLDSSSYRLTIDNDLISCLRIKYFKIKIDSWPPKKRSARKSYRKYLKYMREVGDFIERSIPLY